MCNNGLSEINYVGKKYVDDTDHPTSIGGDTKANVVKRSELPPRTRVLREGSMYTMDFDPDRLNLHLDQDNVVVRQHKG